ncbi:hypothetical protein MIMGU_mgv1a016604mg [Erythranthe guttata]|uniref:Uncharacterized protein n=1 Tax=Erythranthe guttata TaxID=4155 RepID=A0A022RLJ9_ERYGU|nr:hypothetical protein MIMGU_mgv1a016604mg [Erythranthe guttata]
MGRQARAANLGSEIEGSDNGPSPKANMISLKLASQAKKKADEPPRCIVCRLKGRIRFRIMTGITIKSLDKPFGTCLAAKKQKQREAKTSVHTLMKFVISPSDQYFTTLMICRIIF